jgi:hypothetical protein
MRYPLTGTDVPASERSRKWLFAFWDRQGALADGLHGLNPYTPHTVTPQCCDQRWLTDW